jgi:hypothetical protein
MNTALGCASILKYAKEQSVSYVKQRTINKQNLC